jgi:hypothetical protein
MLRLNTCLACFISLPAALSACQAGTSQGFNPAPQPSQTSPTDPFRASLVVELDRAILVLKRGLKEHWETRDRYLTAFEKTPGTDPTGRQVADAKSYVECAIGARLRTHRIWDEGVPIEVEVQNTIDEFLEWREDQATARLPLPCFPPAPRKVRVSAGVAASLLRTKIDPIYPADGLKNHISGIVALHAGISTRGAVKALRVVSGPDSLRQAALNTVRQWIYRPYLLNNMPVEFETTVDVVFTPNR